MNKVLKNSKILVTGGAGFIGSNLVEYFLSNGNEVICLDNLSTGHKKNLTEFIDNRNFQFIEGDIRDINTCKKAVQGCEYVFHQAALGSVPRSIADPVTTNSVNIDGFLNMLTVSRDEKVKRFIYAASSSTYGDSMDLPKVEEKIGRPLSPYAITKVVNEYFAKVYSELYGMETIGLRYFNVFGKRQDPNGAYAAVIPLWVKKMIRHESPVINGDGSYSRDFTYIDNVIQANELAAIVSSDFLLTKTKAYFGNLPQEFTSRLPQTTLHAAVIFEVFNVAFGGNTSLNQLFEALRLNLTRFDKEIENIRPVYGPFRQGDIPHSLASIEKVKCVLGYNPEYSAEKGFEIACEWYYRNLR
jgi:UDP-N-acetylglucosamine 4-epimerase